MNTRTAKPKARRFSTNAKVLTTTAAVATLVAGWNAIAHWDNAQADNQPAAEAVASAAASTTASTTASTVSALPTATPAAVALSADALGLTAIPTLVPVTDVFTQALEAASTVAQVDLTLPAVATPSLPALEALPALPSAPAAAQSQVPAPSTSSQAPSRGHATSGGS